MFGEFRFPLYPTMQRFVMYKSIIDSAICDSANQLVYAVRGGTEFNGGTADLTSMFSDCQLLASHVYAHLVCSYIKVHRAKVRSISERFSLYSKRAAIIEVFRVLVLTKRDVHLKRRIGNYSKEYKSSVREICKHLESTDLVNRIGSADTDYGAFVSEDVARLIRLFDVSDTLLHEELYNDGL